MFKIIILLSFLFLSLFAEEKITKEWLNQKPKGNVKDFYLWRYIEQNQNNENEIVWALSEANNANHKIFFKYVKKKQSKNKNPNIKCLELTTSELINSDSECIDIGLSILDATSIRGEKLSSVIKKIKTTTDTKIEQFSIVNADNPFENLINSSSNEIFYGTFNGVGQDFRIKYFDAQLPKTMIEKLQSNNSQFRKFIKTVVTTPQINTIQQSLFDVNTTELHFQDIFYLAINAIKHERKEVALQYLAQAKEKARKRFDADNVLFWQYKLTNDPLYLSELADSWDLNIYSLLAREALFLPVENAVFEFQIPTPIEPNILRNSSVISNETSNKENNNSVLTSNISTQEESTTNKLFDVSDPFAWRAVLDDIRTDFNETKLSYYETIFNTKETLGHITLLREKYEQYKVSYFPNPFDEYIKDYSIHRQALINGLARQESRFVQASLSTSYAMGVMQIMPFLSEAIAKELNETYDITKQLEAKTNIRYANHHLDYLESRLDNVLFVAYAYNGGIGFTNRLLKSGLFQKGPYEPFLSMELVHYDESKYYGKKVLLNYLMYYNYFNKSKLRLSTLIETIKSPYQEFDVNTQVKAE